MNIFNSKKRFQKKIKKLLEHTKPIDKSNKERLKWKVQISGVQLDDLLGNPPREIPFSRDEFRATREEAEALAILEYSMGNDVEIWRLVKRWN